MDQNLEPLIVFSFSKMECEFFATQMNKMDFNTGEDYPSDLDEFALVPYMIMLLLD